MTTWNYIIGNEKDFEGAPDWATLKCYCSLNGEPNNDVAYCEGIFKGAAWKALTKGSNQQQMDYPDQWYTIAQREPVESSQWVYHLGTPEMFARMSEGVTHLFRNMLNGVVQGVWSPDVIATYSARLDYELIGHRESATNAVPVAINDVVNHPSHYTQGGIECIDAITAATVGKTGIEAVCVANVVKYLWRYEEKNGLEDVKKARWYLERLTNELENNK